MQGRYSIFDDDGEEIFEVPLDCQAGVASKQTGEVCKRDGLVSACQGDKVAAGKLRWGSWESGRLPICGDEGVLVRVWQCEIGLVSGW